MKKEHNIIVYQAKTGAIELREDVHTETIWATLQQIADLFDTDKSGISRHIRNIFDSKELDLKATVAIFATVQKEGKREVSREIEYFNLDMILSVGYRVNSKKATIFRQWATKTLHSHIVDGYTINKKRLAKNYDAFLKVVEQVKALLPSSGAVDAINAMELVKMFANTWLSLDAYDKSKLPKTGATKRQVEFTAEELTQALQKLKHELMSKGEATGLFGSERGGQSVSGIVGNIFQTFDGKDLYPTVEEKAAHLLYFMVKNHPYVDGNKRSGAFSFVWFLKQAGILNPARLTAEALTALTLFVAESSPKDKDKMVGLVLLLLN
ncbi:virulence protein RhuM/Fic/DOC family protein [Candidatus Peregrinibacteria bacterium]|nr:virulence protein RhuM/Fic/DOC family protein [Candidatus Peregrinibacteria bacterium]